MSQRLRFLTQAEWDRLIRLDERRATAPAQRAAQAEAEARALIYPDDERRDWVRRHLLAWWERQR